MNQCGALSDWMGGNLGRIDYIQYEKHENQTSPQKGDFEFHFFSSLDSIFEIIMFVGGNAHPFLPHTEQCACASYCMNLMHYSLGN